MASSQVLQQGGVEVVGRFDLRRVAERRKFHQLRIGDRLRRAASEHRIVAQPGGHLGRCAVGSGRGAVLAPIISSVGTRSPPNSCTTGWVKTISDVWAWFHATISPSGPAYMPASMSTQRS